MLPEKYRRLWQRRLRRRPLLPFLLVAFALLDCVTIIAFSEPEPNPVELVGLAGMGAMVAQLNMLGVWVSSRRFGVGVRLFFAGLFCFALAAATEWAGWSPPGTMTMFFGCVLVLSAGVAGVTERIVLSFRSGLKRRHRFRFTIGFLMAIATMMPLLELVAMLGGWKIFLEPGVTIPLLVETSVVAIVVLVYHGVSAARRTAEMYVGLTLPVVFFVFIIGGQTSPLLSPAYYTGVLACLGVAMTSIKVRGVSRVSTEAATRTKDDPPKSIDLHG